MTSCSEAALAEAYTAYRSSNTVLVRARADEKRRMRDAGGSVGARACSVCERGTLALQVPATHLDQPQRSPNDGVVVHVECASVNLAKHDGLDGCCTKDGDFG